MAIRVEHMGVAPVAGLAQQAGEAVIERESRQRQFQIASQLLAQQHQRQMAEFEADLQLEKMKRAELWELEKMELASRNDFAVREKIHELDMLGEYEKQKRKQDEMEAKLEAVDKADWLSESEKQAMRLQVQTGIQLAPKALTPEQQIAQRKLSVIDELSAKIGAGTATTEDVAMYNKMLAGAPMVEIGFGKPASAAERTKIAEARASRDALMNLKQLYSVGGFGEEAPVSGRLAPFTGLFGMTTDQQEAFMAATSAFKNAIIKQITGAQMSEPEARRIMKQIPDITDPPVRWNAKWEQSLRNVEAMEQRQKEVLRQSGLRVPETVEDMIQSATTEELLELVPELKNAR